MKKPPSLAILPSGSEMGEKLQEIEKDRGEGGLFFPANKLLLCRSFPLQPSSILLPYYMARGGLWEVKGPLHKGAKTQLIN